MNQSPVEVAVLARPKDICATVALPVSTSPAVMDPSGARTPVTIEQPVPVQLHDEGFVAIFSVP